MDSEGKKMKLSKKFDEGPNNFIHEVVRNHPFRSNHCFLDHSAEGFASLVPLAIFIYYLFSFFGNIKLLEWLCVNLQGTRQKGWKCKQIWFTKVNDSI